MSKFKICIITQNEPFYLYENLDRLLSEIRHDCFLTDIYILPSRPYGKKQSLAQKLLSTLSTFGGKFILLYIYRYLIRYILGKHNLIKLGKKYQLNFITIRDGINIAKNVNKIKGQNYDIIFSILGSEIFDNCLINSPNVAFLNLHCSLLPRHRGMMPSFWSMYHGDATIGVSVFRVAEGIDQGEIIVQKEVQNRFKRQSDLIRTTKNIGITAFLETLDILLPENGNNKSLVTESYNKMPSRNQVKEFRKMGNQF